MGFRLRKSVKLGGPFRLNVSKSGLGISAGVKGVRYSVGPHGQRTTVSLPGTGLSYVATKGNGRSRRQSPGRGRRPASGAESTRGIAPSTLTSGTLAAGRDYLEARRTIKTGPSLTHTRSPLRCLGRLLVNNCEWLVSGSDRHQRACGYLRHGVVSLFEMYLGLRYSVC